MPRAEAQWQANLVATAATVLVASLSGYLAGCLVDTVDPARQPMHKGVMYEDSEVWHHTGECGGGGGHEGEEDELPQEGDDHHYVSLP